MIIDTHCHICLFDPPRAPDQVITEMLDHGVSHAIQVGTNMTTSSQCIALAQQFPSYFSATIGVHPVEAQSLDASDLEKVKTQLETLFLTHRKSIVALGEIGLDYYHLDAGQEEIQKQRQHAYLEMQCSLAQRYDLPIVFHVRDAWEDIFTFLETHPSCDRCVFHCHTADRDMTRKILDLRKQIYFWCGGMITFEKAHEIRDVMRMIPKDRILLETDAPYLTPEPYRKTIPHNTPAYTARVFEYLRELRPSESDILEDRIYRNTCQFFGKEFGF